MNDHAIIKSYFSFLDQVGYPCVAAKAALAHEHIRCRVSHDMTDAADDEAIVKFLHAFVDDYRSTTDPYHSAAIIFKQPVIIDEDAFDRFLWQRLEAFRAIDRIQYNHDPRVSDDPSSNTFSFSLKEEAFFIIGLHPQSSREARRFQYPTLVFNPHAEFEKLRATGKYEHMKAAVRKRDHEFSGSVNPMLSDFGEASEVYQYSGKKYDNHWQCPFHKHEERTERDSTTERHRVSAEEGRASQSS